MFTGLVEEVGTVVGLERLDDAVRLSIRGPRVTDDAAHGDSIAVNGCCLTVTTLDGDVFAADVMAESLERTSLGSLAEGSPVNLERALAAGDRLGGHLVQGHVDGTATLLDRSRSEHWETLRFALPAELARYVVEKGSITVDGTSLTVVQVVDAQEGDPDAPWFSVSLIPTTLADTTLGAAEPGTRVNLEVDILAKYVERLLGPTAARKEAQP
jgi:riboflavin synthase